MSKQQLTHEQKLACERYNLKQAMCNPEEIEKNKLLERCRKVGIIETSQCEETALNALENNLPELCEYYRLDDTETINKVTSILKIRFESQLENNKALEDDTECNELKIKYQAEVDETKKKKYKEDYIQKKLDKYTPFFTCTKENTKAIGKKCGDLQLTSITGYPCNLYSTTDLITKCEAVGLSEKDCNLFLLQQLKSDKQFEDIIALADQTLDVSLNALTGERELAEKEFKSRQENFKVYSEKMKEIQDELFSEVTRKMIKANKKVEEQILLLKREKRMSLIAEIKDYFVYIIGAFLVLIVIFVVSV